jgi:hypothetical protein
LGTEEEEGFERKVGYCHWSILVGSSDISRGRDCLIFRRRTSLHLLSSPSPPQHHVASDTAKMDWLDSMAMYAQDRSTNEGEGHDEEDEDFYGANSSTTPARVLPGATYAADEVNVSHTDTISES